MWIAQGVTPSQVTHSQEQGWRKTESFSLSAASDPFNIVDTQPVVYTQRQVQYSLDQK